MAQLLTSNKALKVLGLSCNKYSHKGYTIFKKALLLNKVIDVFDVSNNEMPENEETELIEIATKKNLERKNISFISKATLEKHFLDKEKEKVKEEEIPEENGVSAQNPSGGPVTNESVNDPKLEQSNDEGNKES